MYELAYGMRTAEIEPRSTLELTRPEHLAYGSSCLPSQPQDIRSVFNNLGLDFRKYCFVDLGCGKGRVLANAARYAFKSVIGVDFAKQLCEASKSNLERVRCTRRSQDCQVHHVYATE